MPHEGQHPSLSGMKFAFFAFIAFAMLPGPVLAQDVSPAARPAADPIPVTRWDHRDESDKWSLATLQALKSHGSDLVDEIPGDMANWCPGYANAPPEARRSFWVGFLSALAKFESTHKPRAVGGGGKWFGLLQIAPATARGYGCRAGTGEALKVGAENLSCAVRIMAETVSRDGVIHAREPNWRGVAADWAPLRSPQKREEMRNWLRGQDYCQIHVSPRPVWRPSPETLVMGPIRSAIRALPRPETTERAERFSDTRPF